MLRQAASLQARDGSTGGRTARRAMAAVSWRAFVAAAALSLVLGAAVSEGVAAGAGYSLRIDPLTQQAGELAGTGETDLGNFGRGATLFKERFPPIIVQTGPAFATSTTSASLSGWVEAAPGGGKLTACEFVYESLSYGETGSVPCEIGPEYRYKEFVEWEVGAEATGLEPHTTYWVELYAANAAGEGNGGWRTFRTFGEAPAVVTRSASAITPTSATLNATVNPNGEKVTECYFEWWGPSTHERKVAKCSSLPGSGETPVAVSAPLDGLSEASTYHFLVVATNASGESKGSEETFETRHSLAAVTGSASAVTRTSATLNATVNPGGEEVTECYFEWWGPSTYESNVAACSSLPGSGETPVAVSAPIEGLSEASTYHFLVVATNASGESYGWEETFETRPYLPAVVTGSASAVTRTSATLNASVNPGGEEVTECYFEWGATASYGNMAACSSLPGSGETPVAVSAPIEGLSELSTYHFRVVATDERGTSYGSEGTVETRPYPVSVVTGSASAVTRTSATLNATVNPDGEEVTECYFEWGATASYGNMAACSSLPSSGETPVAVSAPIEGLSELSTYHFRMVATDARGTSYGSDETFTTLPGPPVVVTGSASSITSSSATLNGTVNPNGGNVSSCEIEYGTSPTLTRPTTVSCASPGSGDSPIPVSAAATGLAETTTYYFRVQATNAGGTSQGDIETFTTLQSPPVVVTGSASSITSSSATLNGTVNPSGGNVSSCEIEYATSPTLTGPTTVSCGSPGSGDSPIPVSAAVTGLTPITTYYFRVDATNAGGTGQGAISAFTTLPNPPVVVTGSASSITSSSATLNGTVNPSGGNVSSCEIEYGTSPTLTSPTTVSCGSPGSGDSPVPVSAAVTGLAETTTYYFRVQATNAGGTSKGDIETFTTFTNQPTLTKIEPDAGLAEGGTHVKIKGMYLTGATEVKFGGTAVPASCSETECTTTSPAGTGTVSVTVRTAGGTSNAEQFIYVPVGPAPTVIGLSVTSGPTTGGTSVTITGTGFTGVTAVKFGPNEAVMKSYSETSITVESPAGTGTVYVTVTTPNGTSPASGKSAKHAKFKYKKVKVEKVKK